MNILTRFLYGLYFSLTSIIEFKTIFFNNKAFKIYSKIILANLIFLSFLKFFFDEINSYLIYITRDTYFSFLCYLLSVIYFITMYICIYPFIYIWSLDGFGNLFNNILKSDTPIQPFEKINEKIYFALLGILFFFINNLFYFIPYIGNYISIIYLSYCYGFFCLDYGAQFNSIHSYNKLIIFENDPVFFMSFGLPYGLLANYLNLFHFFTIFSIIFPYFFHNFPRFFHGSKVFKPGLNKTFQIFP